MVHGYMNIKKKKRDIFSYEFVNTCILFCLWEVFLECLNSENFSIPFTATMMG